MITEILIAISCIIYLFGVGYLLHRNIGRNRINRIDPQGRQPDVDQSGDVEIGEKISSEEKKYKRQQLIRSRLEYRQISSTLSPLSETTTQENGLRIKEISPRDLESGITSREFSDTALQKLMKMGYAANISEKALKAVGGSDVEAAVYWIFKHKTDKVKSAEFIPEGVPVVKSWVENDNGGIRGRIYGSSKFEDGDFVETSKIVEGVIENDSIVATKSGTCYFLSADSADNTTDDDEISTHSRLGSVYSAFESLHSTVEPDLACRDDCISCRRDSASHSVRSRLDSLDSAHSRRDSGNHSRKSRIDSLAAQNKGDALSTSIRTQEVCSICLEPYRAGDIVVRLKQKREVKDAKWFRETLNQLKNRTSYPNYGEETGSNQWFDDIVSQLKDATEEIQKQTKATTCNHWFHEECLVGWLEKNDECPLCRVNMIRDE